MIEIPGYQIKRAIGQGGMASVFLAVQTSLERQVALKVMAPALAADPTFTRRFLQEARTLASLAHPNIVQVFDVGVTPNQQHYFSMQYLPNGDFISRVQAGLDQSELKRVLSGIARALAYAHHRGYVHRDVAPGNILFDPADNPVLTDFGIALAASQSTRITSTGFSVGTSHYMSPEQARGGDIDARSDIYSLGVLGWFGLTGKPPFDGADGFAVAYAHVFEPVPRLPAALARWQELFDRALAKDPKDRHADIEQFAAALDAIVLPEGGKNGAEANPKPAAAKSPAPEPDAPAKPAAATVVTPRPDALRNKPAPRPTAAASNPRAAPAKAGKRAPLLWVGVAAAGLLSVGAAAYFATRAPVSPSQTSSTRVAPPAAVAASTPPPAATTPPAAVAPPPTATVLPSDSAPPAAADATPPAVAPADLLDTGIAAASTAEPTSEGGVDPVLDPTAEPSAADAAAFLASLPTVEDPVQKLVKLGRIDLSAQRFTTPPNNNALDRFKLALRIDARDKHAKQGISDTAKAYVGLADKAISAGDVALARTHFDKATELAALVPVEGKAVADQVSHRRAALAGPHLEEAKRAAAIWDKDAAKLAYDKALAIDPNNAVAQEGLKKLPAIGSAGFVFRDRLDDGATGPELVVLPGAKVAAGRFEVTRGEFRRYWSAGGAQAFGAKEPSCRDRESFFRSSKKRSWQNPDIAQEDNHPVVCISWDQASAYAKWLSARTGRSYRLLSNAEWDALARDSRSADCTAVNLADAAYNKAFDTRVGASCDDTYSATAPVGKFRAAASSVFDIDGNVREWVNACANGAAAAGCRDHRVRGRSWMSVAEKEVAAFSDTVASDVASNNVGFRIARDLDARL